MTNLCTVNRLAGTEAVVVDGRILDLLEFALEMGEASGGKLNICMGSLLALWHDARTAANEHPESAALPQRERTVIRLRFFRGLTQARAARVLGVSQVQVSRIERRAVAMLREELTRDA